MKNDSLILTGIFLAEKKRHRHHHHHRRHHHSKKTDGAETPKSTTDSVQLPSTTIEAPLPVLTKAPETNELVSSTLHTLPGIAIIG